MVASYQSHYDSKSNEVCYTIHRACMDLVYNSLDDILVPSSHGFGDIDTTLDSRPYSY